MKPKIAIIGGGNMGGAIIAGIRAKYNIAVCEPDRKRAGHLKNKYKVKVGDTGSVMKGAKAVILAVKPQVIDGVLKDLRGLLEPKTVVISIAAGITCGHIESQLKDNTRVVRAMPNLPVAAGEGMTGVCPGHAAQNGDLILACRVFGCVGKTVVVEEKFMDAVTAVSGSGPAYVFYFIENLVKGARSLGLEKDIAEQLVMETLKGSLALLESQKESAQTLRERVTSKGGTTQAALEVCDRHKIDKVLQSALEAAAKKAKDLSK